jgi:hypothetical protein
MEAIMDEILPNPLTDVPLLQEVEQRLVLMRMNLLDSVAHLKIAHDAAVVCIAASKQTNADCNAEVASVLFNTVNHRIDEQMRVISSIVKQLGGANSFTEGHDELLDLFDKVNVQAKYAADNECEECGDAE